MRKKIMKVYLTGTPEKDFANEKWEPSCYFCHKTQKDESLTMDCFGKMERLPVILTTINYTSDNQEFVYFVCGYCRLFIDALLTYKERSQNYEKKE